jgi:UDP-N-acetylglucosamine 2-epimerase (non-hydrolysing)
MSRAFFEDLGMPDPDVNLNVGSGSHAEQTAAVMVAFERYLRRRRPAAVAVVGDVNSTLAAALTASKLGIPVAHIEAGLRSHDWSMPEEINRVLTDRLSTWLFTPSPDGDENLLAEGIDRRRIHNVGNVMIDTLLRNLPAAEQRAAAVQRSVGIEGDYGVLTMHRPSNVDEREAFENILTAVGRVARSLPIVFPIHPRTRGTIDKLGLRVDEGIHCVEPLGYLDFLALMTQARLVLTDSGGMQEETSVLGIPCVTIRRNTERPITCTLGTNRIAGVDPEAIVSLSLAALDTVWRPAQIPLWDGQTGSRIADILSRDLASEHEKTVMELA